MTTGGLKGESGELGAGQEEGPRLDSHVWCRGGPRRGGGTTRMGMGLTELTHSGPGFSYRARTAFSLALLKGEETYGSALGLLQTRGSAGSLPPALCTWVVGTQLLHGNLHHIRQVLF